MEAFHAVGEDGFATWCETWNEGLRLLPVDPADLRHEVRTLDVCEFYAGGPRERPSVVGSLRRHFAFQQDTRLIVELHVRPAQRGRGLGGSLLAQLLLRARVLGAEVVRVYALAGDAAWGALAQRHHLHEVECDRFLLLNLDCATNYPEAPLPIRPLASEPAASEQEAWQLDLGLHGGLDTSAPYVPETFPVWRARVLEAPGCGPENVLVTRGSDGALAGFCALRVCAAEPETIYHVFTGVSGSARGQGHGRALKLAAIRRARELGARRLVADTSPGNGPMLALNEHLGYVAALDIRNLEGAP